MCGISGFISTQLNKANLQNINGVISHRGPDADGFFFSEQKDYNIGLGHRRLSILDLRSAANQPMFSHDGRYVIIYNGEVYNFNEIKASKLQGIQWKTTGDTEVILESFARYGSECFEWFNGMFAFAIWDTREEVLHVCRDRIGIKPFYYYCNDKEFVFASELKALQALGYDLQIDHSAITNFLYLGYIPQTQTIYNNCFKLLPGHYATITKDGIQQNRSYWTLESQVQPEALTDESAAKKKLANLMEEAVKKCLISDVPLGVFLSGGVDSSIVAAIAQKQTATKIQTFSIAFREGRYDESAYAQKVASYIGSDHHQFTVDEDEAIGIIDDFLDIYDEPYGDMSGIPTYLVSKLARQNVTVALCGDGADELFMGYGFYTWAKRLSIPYLKPFHPLINKTLYQLDKSSYRGRSYLFGDAGKRNYSHVFSQCHGNWSVDEIQSLLNKNFQYRFNESFDKLDRKLTVEEQQSFFDIKNYLAEELLPKVDRASMQHSLEVRVPFLDSDIIDFALNLSPNLKMKNGVQKYLLKEVLYDYVPKAYFDRPKWGFAVPMEEWLRGRLSYLIDEYLSPDRIAQGGILNNTAVQAYVKKFRSGEFFRYHRIWLLIILQKWIFEKHLILAK